MKMKKIENDIIYICEDCDDNLGCFEMIRRNNECYYQKHQTIFKGKILLDVIQSEFFY